MNDIAPTIPAADSARAIRDQLPPGGLFADQDWRISPTPFVLGEPLAKELESLGRVLLQFYRAANLLYRQSAEGKQPGWIAEWLDRGKPAELIELQRSPALKNELPRVIRPDLMLAENGISITELDSVPGGIGLTAWLNQTYANTGASVIGGNRGMLNGFASIFGNASKVHLLVSEESAAYRPEMEWLAQQLGTDRFAIADSGLNEVAAGEAVYRFFELFDVANIPAAWPLFRAAAEKRIRLTPPPRAFFEEKMLLALLWNRNLRGYWTEQLGGSFLKRLQQAVPYSWLLDPAPLPPQAAFPELNLTAWEQLKTLSQRERDLILKISGYSQTAWGARGVFLGSDLSVAEWSVAVDEAIRAADQSPYVLQRYHKPKTVAFQWFNFERNELVAMPGRVRLCPYYFVAGDGDAARAQLGGVLATVCPADKKIIHGMRDAVLAPCSV